MEGTRGLRLSVWAAFLMVWAGGSPVTSASFGNRAIGAGFLTVIYEINNFLFLNYNLGYNCQP